MVWLRPFFFPALVSDLFRASWSCRVVLQWYQRDLLRVLIFDITSLSKLISHEAVVSFWVFQGLFWVIRVCDIPFLFIFFFGVIFFVLVLFCCCLFFFNLFYFCFCCNSSSVWRICNITCETGDDQHAPWYLSFCLERRDHTVRPGESHGRRPKLLAENVWEEQTTRHDSRPCR